ncbi:MAG: S4 domain-containing protein [Polyangiaceae bacterium]
MLLVFSKSRTLAHDACEAGHVAVNGESVKASRLVRVGDEIRALAPRGRIVVVVKALEEKRQGAPRAKELYEDHSPPPEERLLRVAVRDRGAGRPTKAERRAIARLTGSDFDD